MGAAAPLAVRRGSRGKPSEGSPGRVFPPFLRVEKWGRSRRSEISCPFVLLCPSSVIRLAGDAGCHLPLRGRHFACGRDFVTICRNGSLVLIRQNVRCRPKGRHLNDSAETSSPKLRPYLPEWFASAQARMLTDSGKTSSPKHDRSAGSCFGERENMKRAGPATKRRRNGPHAFSYKLGHEDSRPQSSACIRGDSRPLRMRQELCDQY